MQVRTYVSAIVFFLTFLSVGALSAGVEARQLGLVDIPPCGIQCMFLAVPASGCSLDDTACLCSSKTLANSLSECMLANCTMADTLGTARVQAEICGFSQESKRTEMFLYTGIVYSLGFLLVVLRLAGKFVSQRLSWDDWVVVAAFLLTALPLGCVLAMTRIGFGEHLWNLEDGTLLPILRFFLISSSTYVLVLGLIKVSLVLFYLDIFHMRHFQITAYIILTYIVVNSVIIFFLTIFSCNPVSSFWNRDIKGKCMDVQALAYANSASAIIQDLILLVLPLAFIRKLQMKLYRKVAVCLMFTIGTFGCIATIIRLRALLNFKISIDPTWDYVHATIWTELELLAGFACVSLPSIRILIIKALPASMKQFLSNITHRSRSKSNRTPQQDLPKPQREWKKPSSWINITQDAHDSGHGSGGGGSISSLWSGNSMNPSTRHHMHNGSRRFESAMSIYSDSGVTVTRPPYQDPVELLKVAKSKERPTRSPLHSHGSRDSHITALPPIGKIGCLPEGSSSELNVTKDFRGTDRKWNSGYDV
ncbi:hypothetical protein EK21DRAFT_79147 [Setomelanomma holmii]|uniref:CFEM domain-containing protein n=1 Tax=Setomelanomma holmii TaxID=210430 RepID=A0A9P4GYD1_9PLEO|nr:hypothetical protein EK21DRAFT_79147 [Setomelanomma holmii]